MNASLLFAAWSGSFLLALVVLQKWTQRRHLKRRMAKGLRTYASGEQIG